MPSVVSRTAFVSSNVCTIMPSLVSEMTFIGPNVCTIMPSVVSNIAFVSTNLFTPFSLQLDDVSDRHESRSNLMSDYFDKTSKKDKDANPAGYVVRDAPWDNSGQQKQAPKASSQPIPDSSNQSDFPSLGATAGKKDSAAWGAWGRK